MRTAVIMQPSYLPWLGFFDLMKESDVFVFYDNVQFEKQSWQQRNRIRFAEGELMLTVPVHYDKGIQRKISEVRIDHTKKPLDKHLASIYHSYSKSPNFKTVYSGLQELYGQKPDLLLDLNISLIKWGVAQLGITAPQCIMASDLSPEGTRVEALADICRKVGADNYLSPVGSSVYIEENNIFEKNGITLRYQKFVHPVYPQIHPGNFISHMAFIDYLFNINPNETY
jgi:hypothetical protein